jgi:tetratricopeptide (TPR) repeat protein
MADAQTPKRDAEGTEALDDAEWEKGRIEAMTDFQGLVAGGNVSGAMDALVTLINDPEQSAYHGVAWANLGRMLNNEGYPYAATLAMAEGVLLDPDHTSDVVPALVSGGRDVGDTALLEETFAKNVGLDVDAELRSEIGYLAARGNYVQGNYTVALGILSLVNDKDPSYAKSQALKGVILSQQGRYTDAMAALLVAQALIDDPELSDTIRLNLGRVYYAAGNYPKAIEFYAQVSRESHWWPEAQFERAWAHFRIQDMNGTLGILHTHQSPFYEGGWYFPEAHLLRTYALFLICKFPEASEEIDQFQVLWTPVRDDLQSALASSSDQDLFDAARAYVETGDAELPEMVLRDLPYDKAFQEAMAASDAADAELARLNGESSAWANTAAEMVEARRTHVVDAQAGKLRDRSQARVDELTRMLNDTEIAKLDMLRLETKLYEQAARTGEMPDIERTAERRERVRRGFVRWDFQGEYWADEVGYYRVEALPECPEGLMTGTRSN